MPTGIYPHRKRGPYRMPRHAVTQPLDTDYRLIPLTQGQVAIVDADDFTWLSRWNWFAKWTPQTRSFYVARHGHGTTNKKLICMHREILKCRPGEQVDHKNHDTLDNRRQNLRKCTMRENNINRRRWANASGYRGVCRNHSKWRADIMINWENKYLGTFISREDAARAYDKAAKKYHGEFACLNFP